MNGLTKGLDKETLANFNTRLDEIKSFYKEISAKWNLPEKYNPADYSGDLDLSKYTSIGERLAKAALSVDSQMSGTGRCKKGVRLALEAAGLGTIGGLSAYMAAPQLAKKTDIFTEVTVSRQQLLQLPKGSVIVWNNGGGAAVGDAGREHGHIEISQGNGQATSDYTGAININRPVSYRVFVPKS